MTDSSNNLGASVGENAAVLWDVGGVWGSSVGLNGKPRTVTVKRRFRKAREYTEQLLYGFGGRRPKVGDFIASPRDSGRTAIFEVRRVERQRDPSDMWCGDGRFIGYADEPDVARRITPCVKGKPGFEGLMSWTPSVGRPTNG